MMATIAATNWLRASTEITRPMPSAVSRKSAAVAKRTSSDPRSGTPKRKTAIAVDIVIPPIPMMKYGTSLPSRISVLATGVTMMPSMVPRSHSRATTSAVSNAPISVMMMAIRPGTR